jgi:hypothetical protein
MLKECTKLLNVLEESKGDVVVAVRDLLLGVLSQILNLGTELT